MAYEGFAYPSGPLAMQVSAAASVSLGYLSEIERGQKEASSELLTAVCGALGVPLSAVLSDVSLRIARAEAIEAGLTPLPLARAGKPVSASAA